MEQQNELQQKYGRRNRHCEAGSREQINQTDDAQQADERTDEIDFLNPRDIGMQTRNDTENIDCELSGKSGEDKSS